MERSTLQGMAKHGKSIRQIAQETGRNRRTVARVLREPVERAPATRQRRSRVAPYRPQIARWLEDGLTAVRMLELARQDPERPYTGGRSQFGEMVRRVRRERDQQQAVREVPVRFEGLPGEYLQVAWGAIRRFPFTQQRPATRYFLACRLKYSRWTRLLQPLDLAALDHRHALLRRSSVAWWTAYAPWAGLGPLGARLRQHEDGDERAG